MILAWGGETSNPTRELICGFSSQMANNVENFFMQ